MGEIYRKCPKFTKGGDVCCGAHHQSIREGRANVNFVIEFLDGRDSKVGKAFYLSDPELVIDHHVWVTEKMESEDVIQLYGQLSVTNSTVLSLREIHPGTIITRMYPNCPFRLASFRKRNTD